MMHEVCEKVAEQLRQRLGSYTHPGLSEPDPDCHCLGCLLDALTVEDREWFQEHGWTPPQSGIVVYTDLPEKPRKPCVLLNLQAVFWHDTYFTQASHATATMTVTFLPLEADFPSAEVGRFIRAAPAMFEGALAPGMYATHTNVSLTVSPREGEYARLTIKLYVES